MAERGPQDDPFVAVLDPETQAAFRTFTDNFRTLVETMRTGGPTGGVAAGGAGVGGAAGDPYNLAGQVSPLLESSRAIAAGVRETTSEVSKSQAGITGSVNNLQIAFVAGITSFMGATLRALDSIVSNTSIIAGKAMGMSNTDIDNMLKAAEQAAAAGAGGAPSTPPGDPFRKGSTDTDAPGGIRGLAIAVFGELKEAFKASDFFKAGAIKDIFTEGIKGQAAGQARGAAIGRNIGRQVGAGGLGGAIGGAIGGIAGGAAGAMGAMGGAISGMVSQIQQVVQALSQFVQAIAPGVMAAFMQSLKDLQATIGYAFIPIFTVLTDVFRQFGGIILPLVQEMQPIIKEFASVIGGQLVEQLRLFATIFRALLPILEVGMKLYEGLVEIMTIFIDFLIIGIRMLMDFVKALFGGLSAGDFKDAIQQMIDAIKEVIKYWILFMGHMYKFFGMMSFLEALTEQFDTLATEMENKERGLVAAPTSSGLKDAAQIAKDLATAAAIASGGGGGAAKSQAEYMREIAEGLKLAKDDGMSFQDFLRKILAEILEALNPAKQMEAAIPEVAEAASASTSALEGTPMLAPFAAATRWGLNKIF